MTTGEKLHCGCLAKQLIASWRRNRAHRLNKAIVAAKSSSCAILKTIRCDDKGDEVTMTQ